MNTIDQNINAEGPNTSLSIGDHDANLNGVNIHYRILGHGPLIFVMSPGWGIGSGYLQRGFIHLLDTFRMVFVDTRGSGRSARPADQARMSSNDMAVDLEALRAHLGLDTISLLGHSNAGAIAISYAAKYPNRVKRLVLVGTQMLGSSAVSDTHAFLAARAQDPRYATAVTAAISLFSGEETAIASDAEISRVIATLLPLYLHRPEKYLAIARAQLLDGQISLYAFQGQNAADKAEGINQISLLDSIRAPTLIMSGRHDWICPVSVAQRVRAGINQAQMVIFEESGHMPWIEEPERFTEVLLRFANE